QGHRPSWGEGLVMRQLNTAAWRMALAKGRKMLRLWCERRRADSGGRLEQRAGGVLSSDSPGRPGNDKQQSGVPGGDVTLAHKAEDETVAMAVHGRAMQV